MPGKLKSTMLENNILYITNRWMQRAVDCTKHKGFRPACQQSLCEENTDNGSRLVGLWPLQLVPALEAHMSKAKAAAAQNTQVVEKAPAQNGYLKDGKFVCPDDFKKVKYSEWPKDLKEAYKAYRKAGYEKIQKALDEKWDRLIGMLDGEALALAKELREGGPKKKANPAADLFGKESPEVGDKVPFSLDKLKLIEKCQAKGYVLDVVGSDIVLKDLPAPEAE